MIFDYNKIRIGTLAGGYITIEYIEGSHDNTGYVVDIILVFISNYDGYDLLTNVFDDKDICIVGIDDV